MNAARPNTLLVMPGLVPGIHHSFARVLRRGWMAGSSPAMTEKKDETTYRMISMNISTLAASRKNAGATVVALHCSLGSGTPVDKASAPNLHPAAKLIAPGSDRLWQ